METFDAFILGVIQGLTEFLPVSSSGHIELGKAILDTEIGNDEENTLFTVVLHFATALSTIIVFRKDIIELIKGLLAFKWNEETQFISKVILSMIPVVIVGLLFEKHLKRIFGDDGIDKGLKIILIGIFLIITGLLLFLAQKAKKTNQSVSWKSALIIGISQAIAVLPGISRSGATISTSVLLGVDKTKAARFSFLMVVPVIFGAIAKDTIDIISGEKQMGTLAETPLIIGFIAAFITGLIACTWMISLVRKAKLHYFSYYCFAVGAIAIVAGFFNG